MNTKLQALCAKYAPYDTHEWFKIGFVDYSLPLLNRTAPTNGIAQQAYDRGMEAAMRWEREQ